MPGTALLHSAAAAAAAAGGGAGAGKNSLPSLHSTASPSLAHKPPDTMHDTRRDADVRSRHHMSSLHHSAASSRDQLVPIFAQYYRQRF